MKYLDWIDLRSDTVTQPTDEMREAMRAAAVGDDVYGEDPTIQELEKAAADLLGKEAALFVPSGTFGNQLALFTHCPRGSEVILGEDCHIVQHEAGAASVIAGVQLRTIPSNKGVLEAESIAERIRPVGDIHYPETSLICLENAHSNGRVVPLEEMKKVYELAQLHRIPVHLDGARIFNAAAYLGVEAREIAAYADSVMIALSKGLCAPVGSLVLGKADWINAARKKRKLMGGGLRQAGFLAAAGLIALQTMRLRLPEDHENALLLADELAEIPGVEVKRDDVHINMVFFSLDREGDPLSKPLLDRGIKINAPEQGMYRMVTHYWISREDILKTAAAVSEILA
ncbi:MAG TPA: low-specificity L-threonine aldolase [Syntrophomonadaceae bacterium]|nr:low-specificity L-threonine aldolase [Syntrophomonadaceae bacterium]HQA07946.1 low-specificity L-threonine aldolase [Syntrophomonadaceae bacterium]HQE23201.1 low-specificity L-threonine aldolase [Syntrophomonadaceae bacterium]